MIDRDLLHRQVYYAVEISLLIASIPPHEAKALKEVIDRTALDPDNPHADKESLLKFMADMDKAGETFLPRLKLLMIKFAETICCPMHTVTALLAGSLGTKIQSAADQPTLH